MTPVDAAISYADDWQHGGAGYELRLSLVTGAVLVGTIKETKPGVVELYTRLTEGGHAKEPIFVAKEHVTTAEVVW